MYHFCLGLNVLCLLRLPFQVTFLCIIFQCLLYISFWSDMSVEERDFFHMINIKAFFVIQNLKFRCSVKRYLIMDIRQIRIESEQYCETFGYKNCRKFEWFS